MNSLPRFIPLAALLLISARPAPACDCGQNPPPSEASEQADAVFHGAVTAIAEASSLRLQVTFEVSEVWKGPAALALTVYTAKEGTACGFPFGEGADYIVYAFELSSDTEGGLVTHVCSRTTPQAEKESEALGPPIWTREEGIAFRRGDLDGDSETNISDTVFLLLHLFSGGRAPDCLDAADANDDGLLDLSDPVAILDFLFLGASPLPPPSSQCGPDPTGDGLGCEAYPVCV